MKVFLGIDTSCYTTSLAAVDEHGTALFDGRTVLDVPPGGRGLRQSEALFQHIRNLAPLCLRWREDAPGAEAAAVAASVRPRPAEGSYLPVFLAGALAGQALAAGAGAAFLHTTHQEGHLRAALVEAGNIPPAFLALHLSGGTTEVLCAARTAAGFDLAELGGTTDLHAGQFIDRLGVAMGLPFPAGPALESLAAGGCAEACRLPVACQGWNLSFSGPLSAAERALRGGADPADLAAAALACLSASVARLLKQAIADTGLREILLGGGVCANRKLRADLAAALPEARLIFPRPELATDNAVGVALLARDAYQARGTRVSPEGRRSPWASSS